MPPMVVMILVTSASRESSSYDAPKQLLYLVARFCIFGEIIVPFDNFDEDDNIVMMMTFELLVMMMMMVMIRVLRRLD